MQRSYSEGVADSSLVLQASVRRCRQPDFLFVQGGKRQPELERILKADGNTAHAARARIGE